MGVRAVFYKLSGLQETSLLYVIIAVYGGVCSISMQFSNILYDDHAFCSFSVSADLHS